MPMNSVIASNAVGVMPIFQWIHPLWWMFSPRNAVGVMPIFQWMRHPWWMFSPRNAVGVMSILQWMYLPPWILSPRNSVRVVPLIARGWRGTSLPRVNVRKEMQRRRCWAFSEKARSQWTLFWQINQKKRNTYGVVSHNPYPNPG